MHRLIAAGGIAGLILLTGAVAADAAPPGGKGCGSCLKNPVVIVTPRHAPIGHLKNPVTPPIRRH